MPIYMNYDGITGDVNAKGHEKWTELTSCQFSTGRNITLTKGTTGQREASAVSFSEIGVSKSLDSASPKLFEASLSGTGKKVVIDFCKTDTTAPYLTITLTNTLVSHYSNSGSHDGYCSEGLNLNFTQIEFKGTPMIDENTPGTPEAVGWDLTTASKP